MHPGVQRARFLAPGDKLGKHDLIRQLAVGGMAELYLARTVGIEGFEKLVVVKRILAQYANNASFVNMFLNEARLAATLHHPNIAQVYDIGQDHGEYFFSMEYVHGEDLGSMLRNAHESGVPVSLDAALTLGAGLCAGLHHAHEKTGSDGRPLGVVHRDVSPSNVLVSYDGAVKLVDFGIARAGSTPGSTAGGLKGKISYMSPEQCRGKATLDRRSDIFSVGTILYELTTGQLPFTDETEYAILNHIVNTDAVPPSQLVADYPQPLEAIVMRALSRDPDKRYATAIDLQTDLEDFAHDNRLRVSPLVLARLMSTLFPERLEEWAHAKAQGAFFVEQHVVRTLIEDSEVSAGEIAAAAPTDEDRTAVTTPPVIAEDATAVRRPTPVPVKTQLGLPEPPSRSTPVPVPLAARSAPVAPVHDLTARVRVPTSAPRSSRNVIVLGVAALVISAGVTALVLGRSDDALIAEPPAEPARVKPQPAATPEAKPATISPDEPDEPAKPVAPVAIEAEPPKPAPKPIAKPAKPRAAKVQPKPKTPPKEEPTWKTGDSPFLPVRPAER